MQRGRYLNLTALAGALALTAGTALAAPPPATPPAAAALPAGFTAQDIGTVKAGDTSVSGTGASAVWTLTSQGGDIQNKGDVFRFVSASLTADGGITARLLSRTGGSKGGWAKSGVMLRETADAGSIMETMNFSFTGANQTAPQLEILHRDKAKNNPAGYGVASRDPKTAPIWLRAQRQGQNYQTLESDNGADWRVIDQRSMTIPATEAILAGITDSSGNATDPPAVAMFDNVSVSSDVVQPNILSGPTVVAQPGNGAVLLTYNTVPGASYNIYRQQAGSKTAAALVNQQPTANGWFIDTGVTNGTNYLYSATTITKSLADPTKSLEGPASAQVLVEPQVPIAPGLTLNYLSTTTPATLDLTGGVLTIKAQGSDIWDTTQQGVFLAMPVSGDYSMNAKVLAQPLAIAPNKSNNVKVGPMIADVVGSPNQYAFVFATSGRTPNAVLYEGRSNVPAGKNFSDAGTKLADTKYPLWLKLSKKGSMISAFQSNDGTTFTAVGTPHDYGELPATTYTGIGFSSADAKNFGSATLDAASIQIGAP